MEPGRRTFHKTTLESTTLQQKSFHTTTLAGNKRFHADVTNPPQESSSKRALQFQKASAISKEQPELAASAIITVDSSASAHTSEYSQRRAVQATPTSFVDRSLLLSFPRYGLPEQLVTNLKAIGIKEIYPWQKQCLLGPGLLNGSKNLVYTAPTGGGKSLVADILMLRRVLEDSGAKSLLVLPYVALVQEKVRWLRNIVQDIKRHQPTNGKPEKAENSLWQRRADEDSIRVVGFFGGGKVRATWSDFDIGVCTFEKANTLINAAIDDCTIAKLRAVVLDELHMLDDDHRGYLMELIATKLMSLEHDVQIIGMSATLQNIDLLSQWLDAHIYSTFYRPIPIEEHLVHEGKIYPASSTSGLLKAASKLASNSHPSPVRIIQPSPHKEFKDPVLNAVVALATETARSGYGALIFCNSHGCEFDARLISRVLQKNENLDPTTIEKRLDLLADLRSLSTGLDTCLAETIMFGVAFHHAGLTTEERDLIADAYDRGVLKVLTATCSLAAGINLPARRVILHNARMGRDLVGPSMLRQMRGRAGRKGKDELGETYLCCRKDDLEDVIELMRAELPQISSGLTTDRQRIQRALLEVIAIRLANSRDSINDYIRKTLLSLSSAADVIQAHIESSLRDLTEMGFIQCDESELYAATQLGKAVVTSSLEPEDGAFIHREMQRALRAFVMDGEMHILYMFTPVQDFAVTVNWQVFRSEMDSLDDSGLRVMTFLGLKPTQVNKMAQGGKLKDTTPEEKEVVRIYNRFYLALQLRDLCNEMPIHMVSRKYDMPRGTVQTLAQTCQGFAAGMIKFCEQMSWGAMAAVLDHFTDRLNAGAKSDLLALAKITFIKSRTARVFYENGFKTVAAIANADPKELVPILIQAQPSKVRLKSKDEQKYEEKLLAKAKVIADSANRLWQIEMQQQVHLDILLRAEFFRRRLDGRFLEAIVGGLRLHEDKPAVFFFVVAWLYEKTYMPFRRTATVPSNDANLRQQTKEGRNGTIGTGFTAGGLGNPPTPGHPGQFDGQQEVQANVSQNEKRQKLPEAPGHLPDCVCERCRPARDLYQDSTGPPSQGIQPEGFLLGRRYQREYDKRQASPRKRRRRLPVPAPPPQQQIGFAIPNNVAAAAVPKPDPVRDARAWRVFYELNIDVYICAHKFLLWDLKAAVANICTDMLGSVRPNTADIDILYLCVKLHAALPEFDPLLVRVFKFVGFLHPTLSRRWPQETKEFSKKFPEVAARIIPKVLVPHAGEEGIWFSQT
ncbi:hypothetical protein F5Y04DRAFT_278438 [Hypomontagnella monticulosa]|nr:hypothetical protein F5Y04DRAFT_278438 [Hypomontagnella monticulosa]